MERIAKNLRRERTTATGLMPVVLLAAAWSSTKAPGLPGLVAGSFLIAAGEALRLWAAANLDEKRSRLTRTGPYGLLRHPLYLGSGLVGLGFCAASGLWWSWLVLSLVFAVFYIPSIILENRYLARKHGASFENYRKEVPALIPRFVRRPGERHDGFCWRSVAANKEHHYAAMILILLAGFWARSFLGGAQGVAG
jgi:protein-S-isoprenylcysteine O-methyltransferase Ste14